MAAWDMTGRAEGAYRTGSGLGLRPLPVGRRTSFVVELIQILDKQWLRYSVKNNWAFHVAEHLSWLV